VKQVRSCGFYLLANHQGNRSLMENTDIITKYRTHTTDTGSTQVQVALLTERINELTGHLKQHRKDFDSRSGLLKLVGRRRRLLNYLSSTEPDTYKDLIKDLGLRK
jgi:small subunit ribosomal protein S15